MPVTAADTGYGSTFAIGDGASPEVFTVVAEVTSITPPSRSRDVEDATHLLSPDEYKEFIAGMSESGDATLGLNYIPAVSHVLMAAFEAKGGNYQIVMPGDIGLTFAGIFTSFDIGELTNGKMTASCTIKGSGKATMSDES